MSLGTCTAFTALSTLLSASLLAVPAASTAAPATRAAPAKPAFDLELSSRLPADPVTVSRDPDRRVRLVLDVYVNSPAHGVRVTAQGEGLRVTPAQRDLGDLVEGDYEGAGVRVVAETPGMHSLTFTVTSDDHPAQTLTVPHVWAAGGGPIPGGGDLSRRTFAHQSNEKTPRGPIRRVTMVAFLNGRVAYLGFPRRGRPHCQGVAGRWQRTKGCVPYRYDERTGLVQVGGLMGRWRRGSLYIENLVPRIPWLDGVFSEIDLDPNVRFARRGERLAGTWRHRDFRERPGVHRVRLVLRRNRTFLLSYQYTGRQRVTHTGRYRVTAKGRLRLAGRRTLLVDRNRREGGLWIGLTRPNGTPDAVHLVPRP